MVSSSDLNSLQDPSLAKRRVTLQRQPLPQIDELLGHISVKESRVRESRDPAEAPRGAAAAGGAAAGAGDASTEARDVEIEFGEF